MSKRMGKRNRGTGPFVQIFTYMMRSPAWRSLTPTARALYVELKCLFNGKNNGLLAFSTRDAGVALSMGKSSASRYFIELEDRGFIVREKRSSFHQKRLAVEWRLTELKNDVTGELATKEFTRWCIEGLPKPGAQKQKPVPHTKPIVSRAGLAAISIAGSTVGSSLQRTVDGNLIEPQAQQRAASTFSPEAILKKGGEAHDAEAPSEMTFATPAPPNTPIAQMMFADSETWKHDANASPQDPITSPQLESIALVAGQDDAVMTAVLDTYPDAVMISLTVQSITRVPDSLPEEIQDWCYQDMIDVVPEGWEREFWIEAA